MRDEADVTVILDRSGSMEAIASDVVGGFNRFVRDQKGESGACRLTLVQFDNEYEVVYRGRPIGDVPALTRRTFQPRGCTALLDAVGRTIDATGARLGALPEQERPERVLMVIVTDGLENASTDYTRERVFQMISTQKDVYGWSFLFLAANQDAVAEGGKIGIGLQQSLDFAANGASFRDASRAMSTAVSKFRSKGEADFLDEEPPSKGRPKRVH